MQKNENSNEDSHAPAPDTCPECGDTGSHPKEENSNVYVVCQCMEKRRYKATVARLWIEADMPADAWEQDFYGLDLSHPDTLKLRDAAREYLKTQEPPFLIMLGQNGTAKTRLAVAIAKALLMLEWPVLFAYLPIFMKRLYQGQFTGNYPGEDHYKLFEQACNVKLLVLDDLGLYKATEWADLQIDTLVGYRYMQGLPTVITSNLRMREFTTRMRSRFSDPKKCQVLVTEAPDYRAKKV